MTQEPPAAGQTPPERPADNRFGEDTPEHPAAALRTLQQAMRRARFDDAERAGVISDLRASRIVRLELLQDALKSLIAQIPKDVDLFDIGLMPGANPRLFIDMIGFVETGRDPRLYRFFQDTRYGRTLIAESESIDKMIAAATDYVARRLLERDKALAADTNGEIEPRTRPDRRTAVRMVPLSGDSGARFPEKSGWLKRAAIAFAFLIDLLGSIAFFTILAAIGWLVWNRMLGQS